MKANSVDIRKNKQGCKTFTTVKGGSLHGFTTNQIVYSKGTDIHVAKGLPPRAYILKKRACNSHTTSLDSKILSVTKNSTSGQLRLQESVCRLRDVWFIQIHPPLR